MNGTKRNSIGIVTDDKNFKDILISKINKFVPKGNEIIYKDFESKENLFNYVQGDDYGLTDQNPEFCFALTFIKINEKSYNISMHFYDTNVVNKFKEIPTTLVPALDPFKVGPDMESYNKWISSGFLQFQQILNEMILQDLTGNKNAEITFGVMPEKYTSVYYDKLGDFIGPILSFFLIIAYLCPLCILVFRMVEEKESRAKEGMKIMGLNSSTYFLSFFLYWLIQNTIYSLINSLVLTLVLKYINYLYIFIFLWLFGMTIFSLSFFLQSLMNKTRVAIIMTVLLYFTMYFICAAVLQQDINKTVKLLLSVMPPTCLGFGLYTLTKFDSNQVNFGVDQLNINYNNFSVANMYIMFIVDILLFLFLGYYLENVLTQQFGIKKPYYFICTKNFWCRKSKTKIANIQNLNKNIKAQEKSSFEKFNFPNIKKEGNVIDENEEKKTLNEKLLGNSSENIPENSREGSNDSNLIKRSTSIINRSGDKLNTTENFQSEEIYKGKIQAGECLQIANLKKEFDDGKIAVDGLNLNIYQNEIFALLGHNGAGKSTTISILTGLYEATSGEVIYDGENILEADQMIEFRKKLGICPQNDVLFADLTVQEHLEMFSIFKGIENENIHSEVKKILSEIYMENKKNTLAKFLSGGEKRKLSIAIALIGGSQIVFLDEPSSGMDITSRRNLWEILKKCTNDRIIVLTTHYMEEAAVLGNRIGIMSNGKLKCCGNALFLIDRFGKYISLNVFKKENADDRNIIEFVKKTLKDQISSFKRNENLLNEIEIEILSEEILIRIPKVADFSFAKFFEEFDKNLEKYKIKTYEASMPSLEDVFLNVSAETNHKLKIDESNKNQEKRFEVEDKNQNGFNSVDGNKASIMVQYIALTKKRLINLIRDKKSFLLEIVVPFLLVLIGLLISSIKFFVDSPVINNSIFNNFPLPQSFLTAKYQLLSNKTIDDYFLKSKQEESEIIEIYENQVNLTNLENNLINFNNYLFENDNATKTKSFNRIIDNSHEDNYKKDYDTKAVTEMEENNKKILFSKDNFKKKNFGSYMFVNMDNEKKQFQFVLFVNTNARYSPVIFSQYMQSKIISFASNSNVVINSSTEPFPLTKAIKSQGQARNNSNLVFFVSIAFALIPGNFITIIIREREINTKHLQILSGVSKFSYWYSNFIFELLKYYVIAGLISIVIFLFDNFVQYFWIFYVLYGPSMIMFTYLLSFIFENESGGQNGIILLNFLFGTLAGNVVLVLRIIPDTTKTGKFLAYIFRIVPSFSLTYGYSQLLSKDLFRAIEKLPDISIISLDYAGMDVVFFGITFFISMALLIFIEANIRFKSSNINNIQNNKLPETPQYNNKEKLTKNENKIMNDSYENRKKSDLEENLVLESNPITVEDIENNLNIKNNLSVEVKGLMKNYYIGGTLGFCKNEFKAVKNLSFNLQFGECFALLGVTGAGKTSTFKCLTAESNKDGGFISINGIELNNNLNQIKNLIGYCPQKDAIFEYMTVYENLDFYARIKGIEFNNREEIISNLIDEMNLTNFRNKISGNLSGGNKRKLSVAISLIGNPPIILLDEPSTGMDPEARRFMWAVIYKISRRSKMSSVILTTHSMEEAETLCRRIGIMVDGEFKCLGTNQYLKDTFGDSFEISYIINNISKKEFEKIASDALSKEENLEDLIDFNYAMGIIDKLDKGDLYKEIIKKFVFNVKNFPNIKKIYLLFFFYLFTNI